MGKKSKKIPINVDGYGSFVVKMPKEYTEETVTATVMEAVLQTLNMMNEAKAREIFHPAMGLKVRDEI